MLRITPTLLKVKGFTVAAKNDTCDPRLISVHSMENQRHMVAAFVQYLEDCKKDPGANAELLTTLRGLVSQAFSLDLTNPAVQKQYPTNSLHLPDVYMAGRAALLGKDQADGAVAGGSTVTGKALSEDDIAFDKFVKRLKKTTKFFGDAEEGSDEYNRRLDRARVKFDERRKEKSSEAAAPADTDSPMPAAEVDTEARKEADKVKLEGNAFLKAKDFDKAVECYSKCIELDGTNAIYYGNRAAAKMHLKEFSSAVDDCKMAISIDKTYVRAHERLASAYRSLDMDEKELEVLENAVATHPTNEQLVKLLKDAKSRGEEVATRAPPGGAGGFPGFPGMPGMPGMGPGGEMPSPDQMAQMAQSLGLNISPDLVKNFMSSPMGAQMQSAMKGENPAMMEMMSQGLEAMKNDPASLQEKMNAVLGGAGNPSAGATKDPPK